MIKNEEIRSKLSKYIYHQDDENLSYEDHIHGSFELLICLEGEIDIIIDGKTFLATKQTACLIFPNQIHSYHTNKYSRTYICIFSQDYCADFLTTVNDKTNDCPIFKIDNPNLNDQIRQCKNVYFFKSIIYNLIGKFFETAKLSQVDNKPKFLLQNIINYVENNFAQDINLKLLATTLGYDYHYISSYFNKYFKCNFSVYVNQHRISCAKRLIETTSKSLTEISTISGYNSIRNFNRAFREQENITPRDYRKVCRASVGLESSKKALEEYYNAQN